MKVLLKENFEGLGRMGEIAEVARGYARNYLIPRGIAIEVNRGTLKQVKEQKRVLEAKAKREREKAEALAGEIGSSKVVLELRSSSDGKLFGSVTNRQLAEALEKATGVAVDHHNVEIDGRIRTTGTHEAKIKLHPDVSFVLQFEVAGVSEGEGAQIDGKEEEPIGDLSEPTPASGEEEIPGEKAD